MQSGLELSEFDDVGDGVSTIFEVGWEILLPSELDSTKFQLESESPRMTDPKFRTSLTMP